MEIYVSFGLLEGEVFQTASQGCAKPLQIQTWSRYGWSADPHIVVESRNLPCPGRGYGCDDLRSARCDGRFLELRCKWWWVAQYSGNRTLEENGEERQTQCLCRFEQSDFSSIWAIVEGFDCLIFLGLTKGWSGFGLVISYSTWPLDHQARYMMYEELRPDLRGWPFQMLSLRYRMRSCAYIAFSFGGFATGGSTEKATTSEDHPAIECHWGMAVAWDRLVRSTIGARATTLSHRHVASCSM